MRERLGTVGIGLAFGFALHRVGFASWDEVHKMLRLTDLRMLVGFAIAVGLLALAWLVVFWIKHPRWAPRRYHPGVIPGAILFGLGWALTGACPGAALAQIGAGYPLALATLAGIVLGNYAYPYFHARHFRWPTSSCLDE